MELLATMNVMTGIVFLEMAVQIHASLNQILFATKMALTFQVVSILET